MTVKTMLVLDIPFGKDANWVHNELLKGGFDLDREIRMTCETDDDGPVENGYLFIMQEIESGRHD